MLIFKRSADNIFSRFWWQSDKVLLFCISILLFLGVILILTTSMFVTFRIGVSNFYFVKNHLLYLLISLVAMFFIATRDKEQLIFLALVGMGFSILFMLLIPLLGSEIKGAKRWIYLGGVSLQPSEFMKVFFPVIFAIIFDFLKNKQYDMFFIYMILGALFIVLTTLLLLQPDVGMTILLTLVFALLLFLSGINFIWIIVLSGVGILLLLFSYFTFPHVSYRVNSFFSEQNTYQVSKSLQAIKEGAIFGRGAGQGVIKEYLPDSHTDFIFTVGLEEFGLLLGIFIMGVYFIIFYRSIVLLLKEQDIFKFLSIAGLSFLIFLQALIHIASNINLIPTKGMTLPFISYGGSSLLAIAIATGFLIALTKKDIKKISLSVQDENIGNTND